ncbi:hypothetical protein VIN01S_32270 [Vibrio inusitatus NBRC 102082]|uniref:Uncharacterized protein n=1 Tax=Vibrio inusitatus NBRC 102082 TaxID=1219070 RepID=A0A4Y3HZ09_9VIBR|nr:hypothetical protein VIN01S_32270 [Vibrio inusitatus NBRC 102082]
MHSYVIYQYFSTAKNEVIKAITLIITTPLVILLLITYLFHKPSNSVNKEIINKNISLTKLFNEYRINNNVVLTGIESGAKTLAISNNKIIAAPYHRNITANTLMINIFIEEDMGEALKKIKTGQVEYILINNDSQLKLLFNSATNKSLIRRLEINNPPSWLKLINSTDSENMLYKVDYE